VIFTGPLAPFQYMFLAAAVIVAVIIVVEAVIDCLGELGISESVKVW
jgi:hypothetical protein